MDIVRIGAEKVTCEIKLILISSPKQSPSPEPPSIHYCVSDSVFLLPTKPGYCTNRSFGGLHC